MIAAVLFDELCHVAGDESGVLAESEGEASALEGG